MSKTEDLISEAHRLRDELIRTSARLELLAVQLADEVAELREAARSDTGGHDD